MQSATGPSAPFLRVPSENGCSDGDAGHSNSPVTAAAKPKRKRSMVACKNCNERRVRCDGALNGLPCSNCKHAGKTDCAFIESKRVRGARGRFESRDGASTSPKRMTVPSSESVSCRARRHSISGTDGEEWRKLLQNSAAVNRATTGPVTYLGESWHLSWVVAEKLPTDEKPLHMPTLMMEHDGHVHNRVNEELWEKGAYVLPRYEVRDLLISQYFEVVHPTYPILCKSTFLHSLQTNTFSHQLVQAVLMVAATHCDWAILQRAGYVSRREAVEGFYKRCRLLWDGDAEPDKITNIQTMFLMQFWWRAVTDHKDTLWWLSGAIRMAQSMGLHRSAQRSRLNERDKRTWRRLWWMLFLRDRQASSHFGRPIMVSDQDCDVEDLEFEDLESEVDRVQALCIMEHVKLGKLVGAIATCEFSPGASHDLSSRLQLRESLHHRLSTWQQSLPLELVYQSNSQNLSAMMLQLTFLSQLLLLNRPIIYTDPKLPAHIRAPSETIASNAADAITKIGDDIIKAFGARYMTQHSMSCLFAAMTVQMLKRDHHHNRLQQNMQNLLLLEKILPMAGWIHRRYSRILDIGENDDARSISISPTALPVPPPPPPPPPPPVQDGADDPWGSEDVQLLHLEHSLTVPGALELNMGYAHQQRQEQQHPQQQLEGLVADTNAMQPEIFDYHWFMENIGDIGNPLWQQQQG